MNWEDTDFGNLISDIALGPFGSSITADNYVPSGVPILRGQNLEGTQAKLDDLAFLTSEKADTLGRSITHPGELVMVHVGTVGRASMVPYNNKYSKMIVSQNLLRIKLNDTMAAPLFYAYWLNSPQGQWVIESCASQTGVPSLPRARETVKTFRVPFPRLSIQKAITGVLGALDDKIAANQKLLQLSSKLLRLQYLQLMDGPLIPFDNIAYEMREKVDPRSVDTSTPQVSLEHFDKKSVWLQEWGNAGEVESTKSRFKEGDLLFGKLRPYFHKVSIAPVEGICSTDVLVIRSLESKHRILVGVAANSDQVVNNAVMNSNGTRMPRAKWADLAQCEVPDPNSPDVIDFCQFGESIYQASKAAIKENQVLARTRDELLPLLMSGKITVAEAEEAVAGGVGVGKREEA